LLRRTALQTPARGRLECEDVFKVNEGRPNIADLIRQGDIALIINTPLGKTSHYDEKRSVSRATVQCPCVTTITGAEALVEAISTKSRKNQPQFEVFRKYTQNPKHDGPEDAESARFLTKPPDYNNLTLFL
jgi:hypothetical protein